MTEECAEEKLRRERSVSLDEDCSVAFGEVTAPVCPDTETTPVLIVPAPYPVAGFARRGWNGSGLNVDVLTRGSIEGDVADELSPLLRWSVLYGAFGMKWVDTRPLQIAPDASPDDSTPELPPDVAREDRIVWEATFFGRYIEDYFAVVAVAASGDYVVATGYEVKEVPRKKLSSALADAHDRATGQLPHRARGVLFLVDDSVDFSELARACEIGEEASPRGRRDDIYDYDASPARCHVGAAAPDTWRAQIAAASERAATAKRDAANGDAGSSEGDEAGGVVRAAVGSSKPVILGALDKKEIQRVVRIKRNAVKYCYEKALVKDPELSGKVTVKFVISAQGRVSSAQIASSTLGSGEVESCLTRQVKRWRFPKPRGGGIVIVKYPFSFST